MKCEVTSSTTHNVLISKEISYKSYKEICSGEPKKVNMGYIYDEKYFKVENNTMVLISRKPKDYIYGVESTMPYDGEVLSKFISTHNIEPNWLDCNKTYGYYDEDLGGWTGCIGQV